MDYHISAEDKRKLQREVIHSRGELLFSRAIVLSEGETEEQVLPMLFQKYFGEEPFSLGINFIGVGGSGAKYKPFLRLARDFNIPVFIFSDGEPNIVQKLKYAYEEFFGETDLHNSPNITILDGTNFEGYLLNNGFEKLIKDAISKTEGDEKIKTWISEKQGTPTRAVRKNVPNCVTCNQAILESPTRDYNTADGEKRAILEILSSKKPTYAKAVAEELCMLTIEDLPPKIIKIFEQIKTEI
ncbi:TOPRIM nucleotidyl transferase/hydrolase domain-containing protein [Pseudoalteromonas sp. ASV78]|uniref:TOPRIM nucleotidyl transferase/hydrolase domain-containing protein n=1 Tax=Pseudoalteromonas sp. ASV78 TaxID=3397851 RepID=UPI0039FBF10C